MYAVGKLGSYISRGVVTVAAPFHPFGGAVDIVVVKQEDGSFKSSPWHIQFGKFQGVLKAREKVVSLNINGVDADFKMYLDSKGGAYFVREVDAEDGVLETASSGEDSLCSSNTSSQQELKGLSEAANGKVVAQYSSTGPRILGYVFGRRSEKESSSQQQEANIGRDTTASLERAEIAADLLEVRWSTSLATRKQKKENGSSISDQEYSVNGDGQTDSPLLAHSNASTDSSPLSDCMNDAGDTLPPLFTSPTTCMKSKHFEVNGGSESSICDVGINQNGAAAYRSESIGSNSFVERLEELKSCAASPTIFQVLQADDGSRIEIFKPAIDSETSGNFMEDVDSFNGTSSESLPFQYLVSGTIDDPELASELNSEYSTTVLACQMDTNMDKLEDKEPCVSVHESNSGFATPDEVETVLQTKVEVILGCKTNKGPIKLVNELVVDQTAPNQAPILKNSFLIEEATTAALHMMEDLRSQERCSFPPSDSLVTSGVVLHDIEDERCISSDLESSGDKKVYGLAEEFIESQDSTPLDSPKPEDTSQSYPNSIKEKFDESNDILKSSTSELIQDSSPNDDSSCYEFSRTLSTPISIIGAHEQVDQAWSHGVENDSQDISHTMPVSSDLSFGSTKYVPVDVSTNEQQLEPTKSSLEHDKMSEELKELLSDPAVEISLCSHLLHEGMGYEAAAHAFDSEQLDVEKLVSLGPDCLKNDKLVVRIGGLYFPWKEALPIILAIGSPREEEILEPKGMINVEEGEYAVETSPQHATESSNGTWRLWPFTKAKSMNKRNSVVLNNTSESKTVKKKIVRAKTPTSEQLASLNLKEGKNTVLFTFSTSMLGEQKVDAHIYLWKWNDRIVISDVDGTITKSDVLGQFMPMVGYDWSQTGVTHLFSAIKENGYKLLFLSARAISQASVTRQFLFNLKQEGKALPEGPVVISPDGLFPSLFREVIRRAPHEFKIACLEDIKSLFPPDTNPFYAGFGNRDTDIVSYVKVGIPKGKVYIINPKGEVAVHRCVATKSYASLHELVNEMFPESSAISLSEKEDFNTWNFWRMPPPETLS